MERAARPSGSWQRRRRACIIAGGQGIELVIVALQAAHGGGEKGLPHGVHDIVEIELARLGGLDHGVVERAHAQESGGDEHFRIVGIDLVARELLQHELVVGLVVVEGADRLSAGAMN